MAETLRHTERGVKLFSQSLGLEVMGIEDSTKPEYWANSKHHCKADMD